MHGCSTSLLDNLLALFILAHFEDIRLVLFHAGFILVVRTRAAPCPRSLKSVRLLVTPGAYQSALVARSRPLHLSVEVVSLCYHDLGGAHTGEVLFHY